MKPNHYDYIIAGGGLSGLSLAWKLVHSPLAEKRMLIIDKTLSPAEEKIWSFWYRGKPPFQQQISRSWDQVNISFSGKSIFETLNTYRYCSIRSKNFRQSILRKLRQHPSVDLREAPIVSMRGDNKIATLTTSEKSYTAEYIFQSCFFPLSLANDRPYFPLIQHFMGWEITTTEAIFDASTFTLMDFDSEASEEFAFVYVLPWNAKKALVEYTIFSKVPKAARYYEDKLNLYLFNRFNLQSLDYTIDRTERGRIPMQDHRYAPWYARRVLNLGTAGGLTKPSTGYTFSRIQKHTKAMVQSLCNGKPPALPIRSSPRYRAYDLWLLQIISENPGKAVAIFNQLFSNNSIDEVFQFLSEENTFTEDLKIMKNVSYAPFLRAIWKTKKRIFEL